MQRLLPTGLLRSVDCLLRRLAAAGLQSKDEHNACTFSFLLASTILPSVIHARVATPPDCSSGHGGSIWRPQDDLGLLLSIVKLARREAELPGGVAFATPHPTPYELTLPLAQRIVGGLVVAGEEMVTLLVGLSRQRRRGSSTAVLERSVVALREAIALVSVAALPILERMVVRDLRSPGGSGGGGAGGGGAAAADASAAGPAAAAGGLRRPGAGRGSRGGARGGGRINGEQHELPFWADEVAGVLVHMAADEQLVGAVAGWLRGEAAALPQPARAGALVVHPRGLCDDLDARALAAALRHWNAAAAASVERLHAAAASSTSAAGGEGERGGSSSGSPGTAASGDGATAPLLAAARAAVALRKRSETALWCLWDGGAGGCPPWPPRVLRLCGNPACHNFAGPAEGDLPLRKCSGCKAVRYCGAGQGQHWREGGHKEACARLRAAMQAAKGGG
ncbi:hypothetical protein TSOC_007678 [Tetrabaena socialis]|uniref:phytol kinase n=1 Tax=Tetrabaena socialis TaxID=47790 RepID=A0A2J8A0H7_9CHLO|nr:hypothetical protein TSOC_007678 [Tetrabaena socialis]|eukprot:PNH06024.1 hypothetical protein TSOC_007678 [Tetrabaena socialis]